MAGDWSWLFQYLPFTGMGLIGAIFANSTGAGGGVVFIPAFQWLGFTDAQSVGTSFAIQCFGMTAGSFAWLRYARSDQTRAEEWACFSYVTLLCAVFSVLGLAAVNGLSIAAPGSLKQIFAIFSLVLGSSLLFSVMRYGTTDIRWQVSTTDSVMIVLIGLFGGVITAWLSVGVGEILALYLLLRGFSATMSVAAAVCVSAISVWSSIAHHAMADNVEWDVILFAGPAAVIGGTIAKRLAVWMPPVQLKVFFSCWVLFMGLVSLPWEQWF
jgi:uncharacterized protein